MVIAGDAGWINKAVAGIEPNEGPALTCSLTAVLRVFDLSFPRAPDLDGLHRVATRASAPCVRSLQCRSRLRSRTEPGVLNGRVHRLADWFVSRSLWIGLVSGSAPLRQCCRRPSHRRDGDGSKPQGRTGKHQGPESTRTYGALEGVTGGLRRCTVSVQYRAYPCARHVQSRVRHGFARDVGGAGYPGCQPSTSPGEGSGSDTGFSTETALFSIGRIAPRLAARLSARR